MNSMEGRSLAAIEGFEWILEQDIGPGAQSEAAFRLGESSVTDLLETHRSATEAELAALDLYEAALAAARELERLDGSSPSATISETQYSSPPTGEKDTP